MKAKIAAYLCLALGVGLVLTAVLAAQLGLDHNTSWGPGRVHIFIAGLALVAASAAVFFSEQLSVIIPVPVQDRARRFFQGVWDRRLALGAAACVLFGLAAYAFLATAGTWTTWPEISRYYDDLGRAFSSGRLDLNIQPAPALLAVSDPYEPALRSSNPELRSFVDQVWDLSFYKGRFYLYWGPAPGALLAILKLIYARPIPDQFLVFGFLSGLFIFTAMLMLRLRRNWYAETPLLLLLAGILVAAFVSPLPWMMGRPAIYEATIAAGQFFLMAGLYFAYTGMEKQPTSRSRLVIAAISWTIASASRTLILVPAAFLTLMLILWVGTAGGRRRLGSGLGLAPWALALPLLLGVAAVGWYNWARFGSPTDTGLRYTLTFHNLDKFYSECFSGLYVFSNMWMYLFNPLTLKIGFPFVEAQVGRSPAFLYLGQPHIYHAEEITGILLSAPFVLFSLVAVANAVRSMLRRNAGNEVDPQHGGAVLSWFSLCLAGSGLLSFGAILFYFNLIMRFLGEFIPSLVPLSALGVWQGYRLLKRPSARRLYVGFVLLAAAVTVALGLLLGVSGSMGQMRQYNPRLLKELFGFFGP